jgi:RNA polymerase sigma-70 factor (ECF subfamily)
VRLFPGAVDSGGAVRRRGKAKRTGTRRESRYGWPQLVALYDELLRGWPSPVVALNRAVPLAMAAGPEAALAEVGRLERDESLGGYQYLPAVKAGLLARVGRDDEAAAACRRALELTANEAERAFLAGRLAALGPGE